MREIRQLGFQKYATRPTVHFAPLCLSGVRADAALPKTSRQPHLCDPGNGRLDRRFCLSSEPDEGAGAAKFSCANSIPAARRAVGAAYPRAICLRRQAAVRLPAVHSHVRTTTRGMHAVVRRRGRGAGAYDTPRGGFFGIARPYARAANKPMIGPDYSMSFTVQMNGTFGGKSRFRHRRASRCVSVY